MQRIIWSGYARYRHNYQPIYIKLNKHRWLMWIAINFHPILILEIGYGYYDDTLRLLNHAINSIINDYVLFVLSKKLMMSLFVLIYLPQLRLHPVFHSSLLELYQNNAIPNCITPPPPPIDLEVRPEYEVDAILDSKIVRNKLYYFVDWIDYSPSEHTWEPVENVANARALFEDFH